VDIDLLYAGERILEASRLTLPHPRLHLRAFVLQPLLEICPERVIPTLGRSVRDLWQDLLQRGENQVCRKIA
jgi:2-amino-4-hydroxy-6-hydroxymethyldihydropteridine diphosphokinase